MASLYARRDWDSRPSQVSGNGRAIGCGLSQTMGVEFERAPLGAGGKPAEKARITGLARTDRHYGGLPFRVPGYSQDNACPLGDEIRGVERLNHNDVASP